MEQTMVKIGESKGEASVTVTNEFHDVRRGVKTNLWLVYD